MDFADYQARARVFEQAPANAPEVAVHTIGLAGESGEVCELIKRELRDGTQPPLDKLARELGDVLWYVAALASDYGLSLDYVARQNIEKLTKRQWAGTLRGSGDER